MIFQIVKKLPVLLVPRIPKQVSFVQLIHMNQSNLYPKSKVPEEKLSEEKHLKSKKYFEDVLKEFYKNSNIQIDECKDDAVQASFMSDVKKFSLVGLRENAKFQFSVIVKDLKSKDHQDLYKSHIAAKNEKVVYNNIFPLLSVYKTSTLPVPVCYSATDEKIIVQDLCEENYKTFNKMKGHITPKECIYTLKALAKFHAATFVLKRNNRDGFRKIVNLTEEILYSDKESVLLKHQQDCLGNIISIYKSKTPTEENAIKIKALEYLLKVAQNDIKDLFHNKEENYVFCHGDLLLTNILFKITGAKCKISSDNKKDIKEMDIKFIDFQKVFYCSVASDLVYLFFINLLPDDYVRNRDKMLNKYLFFLNKYVKDCGIPDNYQLTEKWLLKEMDRFTEYGIISALWILPMFASDDSNNKEEVTKEIIEKNAKKVYYNKRMEKWVDYYCEIFKNKC